MSQDRFLGRAVCVACAALLPAFATSAHAAMLYGLDFGNGGLYQVSTDDATLNLVGNTGVKLAAFVMNPEDNMLYGYTTGASPVLYRIDPATAIATSVAAMAAPGGTFMFEGALALSPEGTAYGLNFGNKFNNSLFTVDLVSGAVTVGPRLSPNDGLNPHDINGLVWRSDGMLVAIDEVQNSLIVIDPDTGVISTLFDLNSGPSPRPTLGSSGDMTAIGDTGYFCAAGPGANPAGTNDLWAVNLFTGVPERIGAFSTGLSTQGLSALAVPEPATLSLLALGGLLLRRRRP